MCICLYVYVYMNVYMCICMFMNVYMCICMWYVYVYTQMQMHRHMYMSPFCFVLFCLVHSCLFLNTYPTDKRCACEVLVYSKYMHIYICMYTYIHISLKSSEYVVYFKIHTYPQCELNDWLTEYTLFLHACVHPSIHQIPNFNTIANTNPNPLISASRKN